jgi:hypothetical protein
MQQHEGWRWIGQSRGVIYICENQRATERVTRIGRHAGLLTGPAGDPTHRAAADDPVSRRRCEREIPGQSTWPALTAR